MMTSSSSPPDRHGAADYRTGVTRTVTNADWLVLLRRDAKRKSRHGHLDMKRGRPTPRIDRLKASIRYLLFSRNHRHAVQDRAVSPWTSTTRYYRCMRIADDLYKAGYQLTEIQRLRLKHVRAVVNLWSELEPTYRDSLRSALRFLCREIRKPQFVKDV